MKRARFMEEQIIAVLKEHEAGAKTTDLARKHGISEATIYNWKAKFGGMDVSEAKGPRALEEENAKLKRLLAQYNARCGRASRVAFKKMVGPAAKRDAVAQLQAVMSLSERRACSIVGANRKMIRYRSSRPPDAALRGRLRDLANERRRFGYRRLFVLLRRDGEPSGINRIYGLYREEGLTVHKRRARRKAVGTRASILVEARPNARWSLDFVHDQFANGRCLRILNIVDGAWPAN
ncbi:transposase InsO family protein [Bradyrhizobium sp. USDA 4503]